MADNKLLYRITCPICRTEDCADVLELYDEPWHDLEPDPPMFNEPGSDGRRRIPCRIVECEVCGGRITLGLYVKEMVVRKASAVVEDITPTMH